MKEPRASEVVEHPGGRKGDSGTLTSRHGLHHVRSTRHNKLYLIFPCFTSGGKSFRIVARVREHSQSFRLTISPCARFCFGADAEAAGQGDSCPAGIGYQRGQTEKGGGYMPDYEKMYHTMFNAATDTDRQLLQASILLQQISVGLRTAQQECEELYLNEDASPQ